MHRIFHGFRQTPCTTGASPTTQINMQNIASRIITTSESTVRGSGGSSTVEKWPEFICRNLAAGGIGSSPRETSGSEGRSRSGFEIGARLYNEEATSVIIYINT